MGRGGGGGCTRARGDHDPRPGLGYHDASYETVKSWEEISLLYIFKVFVTISELTKLINFCFLVG